VAEFLIANLWQEKWPDEKGRFEVTDSVFKSKAIRLSNEKGLTV